MSLSRQDGPRRTVETRKRMNAQDYQDYLEKGTETGMEIYYEGTGRDWNQDFKTIALEHGKLTNIVGIEYQESWNQEESNRMGYDALFKASIDNAKKAFPDHSFIVAPHVNKNGNFHTHIIVCAVSENGKRIRSDFKSRAVWKLSLIHI